MISRRQFLKGAGAISLATILGCDLLPPGEESTPEPKDYLSVTLEYDDAADLSDTSLGTMSSAEKTVHICTPVENSIYLGGGKRTNELWVAMLDSYNEVGNQELGVFYRDRESIPDIRFLTAGIAFDYDIIFKDRLDRLVINKVIDTMQEEEYIRVSTIDEQEALNSYFHLNDGEINSLGRVRSLEEADEVSLKTYRGPKFDLGTMVDDYTLENGIIVKSPRMYGASDKVVLEIPSY